MRRVPVRCALAALTLLACGCGRPDEAVVDEARAAGKTAADFPAADYDYFHDMDAAYQPPTADRAAGVRPLQLAPDEIKGRNTWMMWCGGNEAFWDWLASNSYGSMDLLKLCASRTPDEAAAKRSGRFTHDGLINEPGCATAAAPDEHGLYLEAPTDPHAKRPREDVYGRSSGVVGLRLFKNPRFNEAARQHWDADRYFHDESYYSDPELVRPYRVGMSCAFCHAAPHPLHPPKDAANPEWADLSSNIGNQYWRARAVFGGLLKPDSFVYHVLDSQPPGTIDTSLVASDNINNPNTMNAIFGVPGRLDRAGVTFHRPEGWYKDWGTNPTEALEEAAVRMPNVVAGVPGAYEDPRHVPRILLDGSDSVGAWGALARVYLNIGTYSEQWDRLHNPVLGFRAQKPFKIADCEKGSVYWEVNKRRVEYLAKFFLKSTEPMRLRDAPGGTRYFKHLRDRKTAPGDGKEPEKGYPWDEELKAGRKVFARRCIVCHSSKQPRGSESHPAEKLLDLLADGDYQKWAEAAVETKAFWEDNFLSTDRRVPVTLLQTNAGRSLATNALAGHMWEDFSSKTYKGLPAVGAIKVFDPYAGKDVDFLAPGGGRGYYRPASLISVWATAPYLHNNSVGLFNNDPSVEGRMAAFDDGIRRLLVRADRTTDGQGRPLPREQLERQAAEKRWQTTGAGVNGSTTERLQRDHGLIWRTPNTTWVRVPAKQLPNLLRSTVGYQLPYLRDHPDAIVFLSDHPWVPPLALFVLAWLILLAARRGWARGLGYTVALLAMLVAFAGYFFAGKRGDLVVGPIPAGTPVNLLANVDPDHEDSEELRKAIKEAIAITALHRHDRDDGALRRDMAEKVAPRLLAVSKCPDLVMDRGHYFAAELTPQELEDLIELLKTF